eukprot:TRINITY_DN364_c0_g1_i5.p1 TRINITY_DN364_c0_g1~~TRINITY_DN364_c0_g1_i5.p1  ORF type:complete len:129 (+),score=30.40 TRINITY_DN364_c0_g1_i5:164-550(+)
MGLQQIFKINKKLNQKSMRGLAIGLEKGFQTNKIAEQKQRKRPSLRRGKLGQRVKMIREVIQEVCGLAPYEKKVMELLKGGTQKSQKKALKITKTRLGTLQRGKKKREEIQEIIRMQQKKKEHHKEHK